MVGVPGWVFASIAVVDTVAKVSGAEGPQGVRWKGVRRVEGSGQAAGAVEGESLGAVGSKHQAPCFPSFFLPFLIDA